jgi:3-methylcrotonyl-CoA carboxylase beta subunit
MGDSPHAMHPIQSDIATDSADFQRQRDAFLSRMAALQPRRDEATLGGNEKSRKLHKSRGQTRARPSSRSATSPAPTCTTACRRGLP